MSTIYGRPLFIGSAKPKVPEIFGTGADGDLYIPAGETVTLPVAVPHQSVVEMNYASITIEAGGTLTTSDPNAGLVLRCQGDCTIHGTIDQSGKAPKTNPDSTYPYPEELVCGKGGDGGKGGNGYENRNTGGSGGAAMSARPYGGGYGGGGGGGGRNSTSDRGGSGGSSNTINLKTPDSELFLGGNATASGDGFPGKNGGGGSGSGYHSKGEVSGYGGTGAGGQGGNPVNSSAGAGGGAGNTGGGVLLLYVGGNFYADGRIDCSGKAGGTGGNARSYGSGGGGGGGGGGSIYILHKGTQIVTGSLTVSGGAGGSGGVTKSPDGSYAHGSPGAAGGIGTATVKQYEETA